MICQQCEGKVIRQVTVNKLIAFVHFTDGTTLSLAIGEDSLGYKIRAMFADSSRKVQLLNNDDESQP
jgi:hypothetical protein